MLAGLFFMQNKYNKRLTCIRNAYIIKTEAREIKTSKSLNIKLGRFKMKSEMIKKLQDYADGLNDNGNSIESTVADMENVMVADVSFDYETGAINDGRKWFTDDDAEKLIEYIDSLN